VTGGVSIEGSIFHENTIALVDVMCNVALKNVEFVGNEATCVSVHAPATGALPALSLSGSNTFSQNKKGVLNLDGAKLMSVVAEEADPSENLFTLNGSPDNEIASVVIVAPEQDVASVSVLENAYFTLNPNIALTVGDLKKGTLTLKNCTFFKNSGVGPSGINNLANSTLSYHQLISVGSVLKDNTCTKPDAIGGCNMKCLAPESCSFTDDVKRCSEVNGFVSSEGNKTNCVGTNTTCVNGQVTFDTTAVSCECNSGFVMTDNKGYCAEGTSGLTGWRLGLLIAGIILAVILVLAIAWYARKKVAHIAEERKPFIERV